MKSILQVTLCLLTISYTLSGATYTVTSGLTQDILDISGQAHPYSGPNLSSFVNIPYAELYRADLTGAELDRSDLFSANLARADLTGASLYRADLFNASLALADLTGANLYRANLNFTNMRGAELIGANLFGAEFYFAVLTGADLTGADLEAARFVIRQFGQILIFMEPLCQSVITKLGLKRKVLSSKKLFPNLPATPCCSEV